MKIVFTIRRLLLVLFIFVLFASSIYADNSNSSSITYNESDRLNVIFESLNDLIKKNNKKNNHIENLISVVRLKLQNKDLLFVEGKPNKESIVTNSAHFNFPIDGTSRKKLMSFL